MGLPYRQIHLDFHTPELPFQLGKDFNKETFQNNLKTAHVNSMTLTARCHHGHIYYDSKLPAKHPQMQGDFLMTLVDACHEIDVRCPIYLTVGWDAYMADRHPEWLERNPDGSLFGFENFGQLEPGWKTLCFNSGYVDYLFEQTKETMNHFEGKLDGLFFDIIRQDPCCCNNCIKLMTENGYDPTIFEDRKAFGLETKIKFKQKMSALVASVDQNCSIFYNEGNITPAIRANLDNYSHFEIESLASGDWGYQHFPVAVRYAKNLGKDYLGMTGKFQRNWADFGSLKNLAALEYECFLAVAHGAKCSIGDQMYANGTLDTATYERIGQVYREIEKLEPELSHTKALTNIAILHTNVLHPSKDKVDVSLAGAVNMLNEAHFQFDIVDQLMDWQQYKVLIMPDKIMVNEEISHKITNFVKNGGQLLATYQSGLLESNAAFIPELNVRKKSVALNKPMYVKIKPAFSADFGDREQVLHGDGLAVKPVGQGQEQFSKLYKPMFNRTYEHYYSHYQAPIADPSEFVFSVSSANGIYISHELFAMYKTWGVKEYKTIIIAAVQKLLKDANYLTTNAPSTADVIVNYQAENRKIMINYLNYVPERRAIRTETIEESAPVYQTEFKLDLAALRQRLQTKLNISAVKAARSDQKLSFKVDQDKLSITLDQLNGYEMIVISY